MPRKNPRPAAAKIRKKREKREKRIKTPEYSRVTRISKTCVAGAAVVLSRVMGNE